ncbi:MAG: hypothetical protein Q8N88_03975, partial [Nanoarchaeota archaeon]|nr:hypothetical protein [Nanoarchaeota archaeon]
EDSANKILANGGIINQGLSVQHRGINYSYLCYQGDYYLPCYNLYPMIFEKIENDIVLDTRREIQNCFNKLKEDFESRGFMVNGDATNYSIELLPGRIKVNLNKRMQISKGESSQSFNDFGAEILSPVYNLAGIAREIVNGESQFCNFEYNGFMLLYPKYKISRIDYDNSKIYKVTDRLTGREFRFAVRSCAYPPGI